MPILRLRRAHGVRDKKLEGEHDEKAKGMRNMWKTIHYLRVHREDSADGAKEGWEP